MYLYTYIPIHTSTYAKRRAPPICYIIMKTSVYI